MFDMVPPLQNVPTLYSLQDTLSDLKVNNHRLYN